MKDELGTQTKKEEPVEKGGIDPELPRELKEEGAILSRGRDYVSVYGRSLQANQALWIQVQRPWHGVLCMPSVGFELGITQAIDLLFCNREFCKSRKEN